MIPFRPAPSSGRFLSFDEREEVALLHSRGCGVREIGRQMGRSPSTISRELRRNAATRSGTLDYRATTAQWHADRRAKRPKVAKLAANGQLRQYVQDRLGGVLRIQPMGMHPLPEHVRMNFQVARYLRVRYSSLQHQPRRLDFKLRHVLPLVPMPYLRSHKNT